MISWRTSGFETESSRVLYLSIDRLVVFHGRAREPIRPFLFEVTTAGQQHFGRYLRESPPVTTILLVDLVQEEYRQDLIPHLSARDRQALLVRKHQQYFHDTPYFHTAVQGRNPEGRRDDRVLYTALTNPALIRPWVRLLLDHKVPLAGICSPPLLLNRLLPHLPGMPAQRLVVSMQSISGLRQTFFHGDTLQVSRLVDMSFCRMEKCLARIPEEIAEMVRYLQVSRLVQYDRDLSVCYLADSTTLRELQARLAGSDNIRHYFVDVGELSLQLGVAHRVTGPFCEQVLLHLLRTRHTPNYYATHDEMRYCRRRRMNRLAHGAGVGVISASLLWGCWNYVEGRAYRSHALEMTRQAAFYEQWDTTVRQALPPLGVTAQELKTVADLDADLRQQRSEPWPILRWLSTVLDQHPSIQLDEIVWNALAGTEENDSRVGDKQIADSDPDIQGQESVKPLQSVVLHGSIPAFDGDYRRALEAIEAFTTDLEDNKEVYDLSTLSLPLNVASDASVEGSAAALPGPARFAIRIVMVPPHAR